MPTPHFSAGGGSNMGPNTAYPDIQLGFRSLYFKKKLDEV